MHHVQDQSYKLGYPLHVKIDGLYDLEGIVLTVFPLYGNGPYRLEIFDINMLGGGSMGLDETGNYLQVLYIKPRWRKHFAVVNQRRVDASQREAQGELVTEWHGTCNPAALARCEEKQAKPTAG